MRKTVTGSTQTDPAKPGSPGAWLKLEQLATVQVSSEATGFPIENALENTPENAPDPAGPTQATVSKPWQAAQPGEARIRLQFDLPLNAAHMLLHFQEPLHERSQEWALTAEFADGSKREILRQGWNFSPGGSTEQREEYALNLRQVTALQLTIDPDRGRDRYPATLLAWRIGG